MARNATDDGPSALASPLLGSTTQADDVARPLGCWGQLLSQAALAWHWVLWHLEMAFAHADDLPMIDTWDFVLDSLPPGLKLDARQKRRLAKRIAQRLTADTCHFYERQLHYHRERHLLQLQQDWERDLAMLQHESEEQLQGLLQQLRQHDVEAGLPLVAPVVQQASAQSAAGPSGWQATARSALWLQGLGQAEDAPAAGQQDAAAAQASSGAYHLVRESTVQYNDSPGAASSRATSSRATSSRAASSSSSNGGVSSSVSTGADMPAVAESDACTVLISMPSLGGSDVQDGSVSADNTGNCSISRESSSSGRQPSPPGQPYSNSQPRSEIEPDAAVRVIIAPFADAVLPQCAPAQHHSGPAALWRDASSGSSSDVDQPYAGTKLPASMQPLRTADSLGVQHVLMGLSI